MDDQQITVIGRQLTDWEALDPIVKGNVRINVFRYTDDDGTHRFTFETMAHSSWAGQWKVISVEGNIDGPEASEWMKVLEEKLIGFSWEDHDFIVKDR